MRRVNTFAEAVDIYVARLKVLGRYSKGHQQKVDWLRREFGRLKIKHMPDRLYEWHNGRINATHNGKAYAPHTLNRPIEIVAAVFNYLVALEQISRNPITRIRFPRFKERPRDRYLTTDERVRLFAAIRATRPDLYPIIRYMMMVPCRKGELISAKREQYNPFTATIYIPDSKAGIPIHKPIPGEMAEYFNNIPLPSPWLFWWIDRDGNYRQWKRLDKAWAVCRKVADLQDVRVHDLRHVAATDLYEAGNPERIIMDIAGWKTPMLSNYWHKDSLRSAQGIKFKPDGVAFAFQSMPLRATPVI